jgi:D-amino-acid dehydrogenase
MTGVRWTSAVVPQSSPIVRQERPLNEIRGDRSPDVLVIGGGAVGVTAAYELAREGASVTLIDRGPQLGVGSSAGTAGLLAPSQSGPLATPRALREGAVWMTRRDSPFYIRPRPRMVPWLWRFARAALDRRQGSAASALLRRLARDSLLMHGELADGGIDTSLARRGIIYAFETETGFQDAVDDLSAIRELGLTATALDPGQAREVEPALAGGLAGAIQVPEEAHLDSLCYVQAMGRAAAQAGVEVRPDTEAVSFHTSDERVTAVETTGGEFTAATVLLTAGVWTRNLAAQLGLSIPLEAAKGYCIELDALAGDPRMPVYMYEAHVVATPYPGRLRLAGTLELSGLDDSVDAVRVRAMREAARRVLGGLDGRATTWVWRGFRPTPPDGVPLIGWSRRLTNVMVATGHAMSGIVLAPVTAKLVSELYFGRPSTYDPYLMDPNRFNRASGRTRRGRTRAGLAGRCP